MLSVGYNSVAINSLFMDQSSFLFWNFGGYGGDGLSHLGNIRAELGTNLVRPRHS